jgi:hypothetical protein
MKKYGEECKYSSTVSTSTVNGNELLVSRPLALTQEKQSPVQTGQKSGWDNAGLHPMEMIENCKI